MASGSLGEMKFVSTDFGVIVQAGSGFGARSETTEFRVFSGSDGDPGRIKAGPNRGDYRLVLRTRGTQWKTVEAVRMTWVYLSWSLLGLRLSWGGTKTYETFEFGGEEPE